MPFAVLEPGRPVAAPTGPRRFALLTGHSARTLPRGFLVRAGRSYAVAIAVVHGAVLAFFALRGDAERAAATIPSALRVASWAASVVACGLSLPASADGVGVETLAAARGASAPFARAASWASTMREVALSLFRPMFALAILGLVLTPTWSAAAVALAVAAYSVAAGVVLGAVACIAPLLVARHGRLVFLALTLGPAVAGVPGVVAALSWLIDGVAALGSPG